MITFKEFLIEVKRSADRADNLANYVSRRQGHPGHISLKQSYDDFNAAHRKMRNQYKGLHTWEIFKYHGQEASVHPKHLISTQDSIRHDTVTFMNYKLQDEDPINVIKHNGKHYIYDGHHRWFRDRLLGDNSKVNMIDLDKK